MGREKRDEKDVPSYFGLCLRPYLDFIADTVFTILCNNYSKQGRQVDLGAAQSSIFGSARNVFGSLSRLEPKITAQQQSCTQS